MRILGISAFYHDSAAALIEDGKIIAAAQEERFTRKKHDSNYPSNAINYCLREGNVGLSGVDAVAFFEKPFLKFERLLETYLAFAPRGFLSFQKAIPVWLREKLFQKTLLNEKLKAIDPDFDCQEKLFFSEHHQSHAASAFFPSPFDEALVLTMDGVGEWATSSVSLGLGNDLKIIKEMHFPHSLGLLYSAFTYYCGFKVNSGEYKLMGLAPYGEPRFASFIYDHLIDLKDDGSFRLNMEYFNFCTGLTMTNSKFDKLFGNRYRSAEAPLLQDHMDIAASIQNVLEEIVLRITRHLKRETGMKNLCLAGGVALNCVANGKILRDCQFDKIWIQPAAGDAGGAVGAALATYYTHFKNHRKSSPHGDGMQGGYLGPSFSQSEVEIRLNRCGAVFETFDDQQLLSRTTQALTEGKAIGWFQGRMEFGPRALGARSIIGDPRDPQMQKNLNLKVKFRESFRPFAPAVLHEDVNEWFEMTSESPYMLLVADVAAKHRREMMPDQQKLFGIAKLNVPRSTIPAVTHVDYSARIQTVHEDTNPRFRALLKAFKEKTGCPVVINTSFNVRGEPIVCSPEDAFRCFMGTGLDVLVVEGCWLEKEKQSASLKKDYREMFELD